MAYEAEVRNEIFRIKSRITDEELFGSSKFFNYLKSTLRVAMGPLARMRPVTLICFAERDNPFTACTDGERVMINTANRLISEQDNRTDKYLSIVGMIVHETGHRLFTDFKNWNMYFERLYSLDVPEAPDDPKWRMMMDDLSEMPNYRRLFYEISRKVWNSTEDAYIENRLYGYFSGLFAMGLHRLNDFMFSKRGTCENQLREIAGKDNETEREGEFLRFVLNNYLALAKDYPLKEGDVNSDTDISNLWKRYQTVLAETQEYIEDLKWQKNTSLRMRSLNRIMMVLYDLMPGINNEEESEKETDDKKQEEKSDKSEKAESESDELSERNNNDEENSSASDSSTTSDSEPPEKNDISDSVTEAIRTILANPESEETVVPKGTTQSLDDESDQGKEEIKENRVVVSDMDEAAKERRFEEAFSEVAEEMAEDAVEETQIEILKNEAMEIQREKGEKYWEYRIHRDIEVSDRIIQNYEQSYERVCTSAGITKRLLKSVLKKREEAGTSRGYMYGRFDPTGYPRAEMAQNGRCFKNKKDPTGKPKVAFGILVDESGSMWEDEKYLAARDTAILLHNILSNTDVPHLIVGHTGTDETCDLNVYHDFEEIGKKDCFRLAGISDNNGNRDGAAITYCCEKLLKRTEADKVLIVISDGEPAEVGFYDTDALNDTKLTVKEYSRKGITVFGAVIDGNIAKIRKIYGDKTMDITDLSNLGRELTGLIRRYILR